MRTVFAVAAVIFVLVVLSASIFFVSIRRAPQALACHEQIFARGPNSAPYESQITPSSLPVSKGLTRQDELATLEVIQIALSSVADGETYVWRCRQSAVNAMIKPTQSFKDTMHRVCRHVVITLSSAATSRTAEGIACRHMNGVWGLEG